jgi:hypothetical protein
MTGQPSRDTLPHAECLQVVADFEQLSVTLQEAITGLKRQPGTEPEVRVLERALKQASLGAELARKLAARRQPDD